MFSAEPGRRAYPLPPSLATSWLWTILPERRSVHPTLPATASEPTALPNVLQGARISKRTLTAAGTEKEDQS